MQEVKFRGLVIVLKEILLTSVFSIFPSYQTLYCKISPSQSAPFLQSLPLIFPTKQINLPFLQFEKKLMFMQLLGIRASPFFIMFYFNILFYQCTPLV